MKTSEYFQFRVRDRCSAYLIRLVILAIAGLPLCVNATDKGHPYENFNQWLEAIPQGEYSLHILVCGQVGEQCFAVLKSQDGRIARCFYDLKTGWLPRMSYDFCDNMGKSLLYGGRDPLRNAEAIESAHTTPTDSGSAKFTELFGWAENIKTPKDSLTFLSMHTNDKEILVSIPDL